MPVITPITHSFTLGELSPLMLGRSDIDGYENGLSTMENMFPDSRGPAISRKGSKFVKAFEGQKGRVISLPINEDFYYTAVFTDRKMTISSATGHAPKDVINLNPHFNNGGASWVTDTDGNGTVDFHPGHCVLTIDDRPNQKAEVSQFVENLTASTVYELLWSLRGPITGKVRVGTAQGLGDLYEQDTFSSTHPSNSFNSGTNTSVWITVVIDSDIVRRIQQIEIQYFALSNVQTAELEYVTPYLASQLDSLQSVQSPLGDALYILHGSHPVYKIEYDKANDAIDWTIVTFTEPPPEWADGSYPLTGTFFQGRLWLGGPPSNNTTFWGSKSGVPEDFTLGADADEAVQFTLNRFGGIQWMSGFKTLMMGTVYAEHIIKSEGAFIAPQDIDVEQQSAYGSALIQPVQVGDQIFYVSADRRKLRAIQYEWQADNWLSKDLTFNSEHITESGIRRITWHQNPKNLLHCILSDGTIASLTFERSSDTYGWSKLLMQGVIIDATVAAIRGVDHLHGLVYHGDNKLYMETQAQVPTYENMDSWVSRPVVLGSGVIEGLDHLDGFYVQIQINGAIYPDQLVIGGQVPVPETAVGNAVVGLQFISKMRTLPLVVETQNGSNASYEKRWNKIYIRVLDSAKPIINGIRPATRHPASPMNLAEPVRTEDIEVVDLGYDRGALVTIEQDLPLALTVVSLFGKMATSIT